MALDGVFLNCLKKEIEASGIGARIEKIHQPSREELVLHLRGKDGAKKLFFSAKADAPRVHFTTYLPENPAKPPMFCMLLRKHLTGARLMEIRQVGLERVLYFDFEGTNDLGDKVTLHLIVEIMARYSNIILTNDQNRIIDSVKRVDFTKSSVREVLPGLLYEEPPQQDKLNLLTDDLIAISQRVMQSDKMLPKTIQGVVQGLSPVLCRWVAQLSGGEGLPTRDVDHLALQRALQTLKDAMLAPVPIMVLDEQQTPKELLFCNIELKDQTYERKEFYTFSALLDAYYFQRARTARITQRSQTLFKQLHVLMERASRKNVAQKEQMKDCAQKEQLKIYGDLISANLYCLEKGSATYEVQDFYDNLLPMVSIPVEPILSPNQNAQKYYKEYRKLQTAERMLSELISQSLQEADYLESVIESLSRADSERELTEIKAELTLGGYLHSKKNGKQKVPKPLAPMEFVSKDGFHILVGRNNVQNDRLTLKSSQKYDLWFHTKNIPGSHVILLAGEDDYSDQAIYDAAMLSAFYSKASNSNSVEVDYTLVKNVKKPQGAKPGRVIYETYHTITVTPDETYLQALSVNEVKA